MGQLEAGIKLAPLLTEIKVDTSQFVKDMRDAGKQGEKEADKISKKMESTAKVGEKLSKVGSSLTKGLTLPIAGAAVATTKMAVDFESSFAKVSTLLDENRVDFGQYKNDILKASSESKVGVDEFSESVYNSISAGVDQTKAIQFTTEAMKLAKGGFTDGAKSVDILTTAINGYNLQAEDAARISDLLITTQNLGKTTVDELAVSMGTVIPVAKSSNFSIDELSASYAQLTKNGIATAESGTYLKAMLSELSKSGSITDKTLRKLTGKGFADLKKEGVSTSKILSMLDEEAKKNDKTLKDMFGSVEAGSAALVLYKGNGEEYNEMLSGMATSAGATQKAFEKIDATPAEQLKGSLNELRNAGIKFGASFVPMIDKVSKTLSKGADAFSNMSEEQQESIIKWGAVLAAVGPVTKVMGSGISMYKNTATALKEITGALGTVGGSTGVVGCFKGLLSICGPLSVGMAAVGTGIYALHENSQLMNRSVVESKEELSLMEKALAKLQGVEVKSKKELEDLGLVYKDFGENISPKFQKEVKKSTEEVQNFSVYLNEIGFDKVISKEESEEFNRKVETMCDESIKTIQNKQNESQKALKGLFVADDNVIDESEKKTLEILSKSSNKQVEEVTKLKGEILAIKDKAVKDGRALNEKEIADIEKKHTRIRQIELEALGGTQEEIAFAKNEFNARIERMDAKSAEKILKEKAKARDEEIVQIQASYDTQIDMLKAKASEMTGAEKTELENQVKNLEADKKKKIDSQNDLWNEYLEIVRKKNPELAKVMDKYNGQILTNQEVKNRELLAEMKSAYDGIGQITESGCYYMYNTVKGRYEQVAVEVDKATGDIVAIHSNLSGKTGSAWKEIGESAEKMAQKEDAAFELIAGSHMKYDESSKKVIDSATGIEYALEDVEKATDGTRTGIIDLNGTPYKIEVKKDGTIKALGEISSAADEAAKGRTLRINVVSNAAQKIGGAGADAILNVANGFRKFNGIDNVPYDGYQAVLHKNERVLTAEENKAYTANQDKTDYNAIRSIVRSELKGITIELNDREMGRAYSRYAKERRSI